MQLTKKFRSIANYLHSTTITAITNVAWYVTVKLTIYDAGKDSCDPGFAADTSAAESVLACWNIELEVLEPEALCQQPTTGTLQPDDLFQVTLGRC